MTVGRVYLHCIGTMAESPKQEMHMDSNGILEPTEMRPPHWVTMAEFSLLCAPYRGTELPTDHKWLGGFPLGSPGPLGHHTESTEVLPYLWGIQAAPGTRPMA